LAFTTTWCCWRRLESWLLFANVGTWVEKRVAAVAFLSLGG
jgi:hypothetical protein